MVLNLASVLYLLSASLFILSLKGLSSPETARRGNLYGCTGMALALLASLLLIQINPFILLALAVMIGIGALIGLMIARKIAMTDMPQLIAGFHSLVGLAAVLIALAALYTPEAFHLLTPENEIKLLSLIELSLGTLIGAITFSASLIAFAKLQGILSSKPVLIPLRHIVNALLLMGIVLICILFVQSKGTDMPLFFALIGLSFLAGVLLIIPIGGADMPVIVSMLNSYSGWAAAALGFTLDNIALIITGALVGSSGAILSYIMCKSMNRSFLNVLVGGFGQTAHTTQRDKEQRPVRQGTAEDAAFILKNANSVIIVPGYGMAVAQAQKVLSELAEKLKKQNVKITYAIHPVAGRMPGHMNVLLAEANIPYDEVFELDEINHEFAEADAVLIIGANDVTNPAAKTDPQSPIYGMPVLDVEKAQQILFVKRSLSPGYAGIDNDLFYHEKTLMLFGDAKKILESTLRVT